MLPDPEENFLTDVLRFGCIPKHSSGETDHAGEMPTHKFGRSALVASPNSLNQVFVRITHGERAKSHGRCAETGKLTKIEPLTTLCILPQHLPSVSCSLLERFRGPGMLLDCC